MRRHCYWTGRYQIPVATFSACGFAMNMPGIDPTG